MKLILCGAYLLSFTLLSLSLSHYDILLYLTQLHTSLAKVLSTLSTLT